MSHPLVIAHRGASADAVDNSLDAFDRAISADADMIEFDVRRTRDDRLIAYHDAAVDGVPIARLTREDIGDRTGHLPPLLDEVVELAVGRVSLDVELKESGYVDRVVEIIGRALPPDQVIFTSFIDSVVAQVKAAQPESRAGLLLGVGKPDGYLRTRWSEIFPIARVRGCGADYVAPQKELVRLGVLARAQHAGLRALVWTVNDDATIRRLLVDPRVAGIITDVPKRAVALRDELDGGTAAGA